MILLLQIAVILALARLVSRLCRPLGQPAVIGEMIAGLLLGPSCFGWIAPSWADALFPTPTLPSLNALSQIGLVLFMFLVGLRLGSHPTRASRRVAIVISGTSIVVPFAMGSLLASFIHGRLAPSGVAFVPFMLFMGTAMSITAFPVLARILTDRRLLTTEIGIIAITCAAFDDVTGWLILGAIMTLVNAGEAQTIGMRALLFLVYLAVMTLAVRPTVGWLARRKGSSFGTTPNGFAFILLVMLASAITTEWLGVHALFGAFFAGLMMPREAPIERLFTERVEPLTMTLLLPLFFAVTGLRTNVQLIDRPELWRDAALILTVAVVGKGVSSALVARGLGVGWREATALGLLLNTRGLIELVVLNIGLELGVLSPVVFSMLVLMALITTFLTSPLVGRLIKPQAAIIPARVSQTG